MLCNKLSLRFGFHYHAHISAGLVDLLTQIGFNWVVLFLSSGLLGLTLHYNRSKLAPHVWLFWDQKLLREYSHGNGRSASPRSDSTGACKPLSPPHHQHPTGQRESHSQVQTRGREVYSNPWRKNITVTWQSMMGSTNKAQCEELGKDVPIHHTTRYTTFSSVKPQRLHYTNLDGWVKWTRVFPATFE